MVTILVSMLLGVVPLLGIVWTYRSSTLTTVDGLFLSLILVTVSAVFFLNAGLEFRRGLKDQGTTNRKSE